MYPILFTIGGFTFYTHGLLAVAGIVIGSLLISYIAKRNYLSTKLFFDNVVFSVLFGIIGARLTYYFLYKDQFMSMKELFYIWGGGLVSYGGFILGGLCLWLLLNNQKEPTSKWFDLISIGFFLGLFFGRIGDLFAGEFNGVASSSSIGFLKIYNIVPVSLYEAILCLFIFIFISYIYSKNKNRLLPGVLALASIILYSLGRFALDFWRTEYKIVLGLSTGQVFGLSMALITTIFLIRLLARERSVNAIE